LTIPFIFRKIIVAKMVIKKDGRAVLDMLNRPVEYDEEDEFLDKLDKNVSV